MNKRKALIIVLLSTSISIILFLSGCEMSEKQAVNTGKEEKENINSNLINEKITQNCNIEFASKNLENICRFLKTKDYSFNSKIENEDFQISYKDWVTFKDVEKITYQNCKYIEIDFRKNAPINGNYYPKFRIMEFCFESEKNYGYVLLNGDRLIYCQTGVNMYGFIINDLKKNFEKIIKNGPQQSI